MRIVDAEFQLLSDFLDEVEISARKEQPSFTVSIGRHPVLGKVVVVKSPQGDGVIVEVDE